MRQPKHPRSGAECSPGLPRRSALAAVAAIGISASLAACAPEPTTEPRSTPTKTKSATETPTPTPPPEPTPEPTPEPPAFDKAAHSIDDPMSIWVVGNKMRPFTPVDFEPSDLVATQGVANQNGQPLREVAARATEQFIAGAAAAGYQVQIISAYRPYSMQVGLYNGYVARDGQAAADTYSARPGHSEHQTGLTVDLDDYGGCYLEPCFGGTPAGQWLAANAADYGFILRYPEGKQEVTGFMPEPWHFRYVGPELAQEMKRTGITTLEEFFGLPAAPGYAG
ncbi:M15 family metallopeptidase [Leucobacter luti]|uniref:M15 family metallopeptidase n=1 Tax=Leucobacter luti TaxID=340320 RepID=UPI003CFF8970